MHSADGGRSRLARYIEQIAFVLWIAGLAVRRMEISYGGTEA